NRRPMKLFTVEEANALIPGLLPTLGRIRALYIRIGEMRGDAVAAATVSNYGGGMEGGTGYVKNLYEVGKITTELHEMGVQLKDYTRGLIDFPSMRDG